ncbi:MAG: DNA polymerase III subunit delta [Actinomycetia bacterium]|nr:DNA polymerase III subunit delta [Actinomycetes bacterium]
MSGELKPVYLIRGSDAPKVALAARRLRGRFDAASVDDVTAGHGADEVAGEDVVGMLNALGLFGGHRLVIVRAIEQWKKEDVEAVALYLAEPAPGSVLALVGTPPRNSTLEESCGKHGAVLRYDVPRRAQGRRLDHAAWVQAQFERLGASVGRETAAALVASVGEDTFALEGEVEKLVTWSGGDDVSPRDVLALAADAHEASEFALADSWGARKVEAVLGACETLVHHRSIDPFLLAVRLAGHVGRVRGAQRLVERGAGTRDVMKELGMREYPARKAIGHAGAYSEDELDEAAVTLARLDYDLKGGSRLDGVLLLERAVVSLTGLRAAGRRAS